MATEVVVVVVLFVVVCVVVVLCCVVVVVVVLCCVVVCVVLCCVVWCRVLWCVCGVLRWLVGFGCAGGGWGLGAGAVGPWGVVGWMGERRMWHRGLGWRRSGEVLVCVFCVMRVLSVVC